LRHTVLRQDVFICAHLGQRCAASTDHHPAMSGKRPIPTCFPAQIEGSMGDRAEVAHLREGSMDNGKIELNGARMAIEHGGVTTRFRVDDATVCILDGGRRPIHLRLEGRRGVATIELPRIVAWRLATEVYERTIVARPGSKGTKRRS